MIRIVVREHERFSQDGLFIAMRNLPEQIDARVSHQLNRGGEVATEILHALLPIRIARGRRCLRPITAGKIRRDMPGVTAKFQNVPLRDANVLEELPSGVPQPLGESAAQPRWKSLQRVFETHVSAASFEEVNDLLAESCVLSTTG